MKTIKNNIVDMKKGVNNYAYYSRIDPTRTTTLRNAFVREMNKRFIRLRGVIRKAIVDEDCFGLEEITTQVMTPPGRQAFAFSRSSDKVEAFMHWLRTQIDDGLLQVTEMAQVGLASEAAWTNLYIQDSYQRGVMRARRELKNAGYAVPSIEQTGGLAISMSNPFHMDRVGLLYSRVFSELRGITNAMDQQISRVLAQGIADGDNPRLLARKLTKTIFGKQGDLALTDTLGRFIPAQRRAQTLARTEIIRAHHQATIQEYRNWGLEGVRIKAEWSVAGFGVCPECGDKEAGNPYTLDQIESMIPLHPNCFIDRQIPIYTSKGWKQIGDIEVDDLVLTHKKRFRKVTKLIRQEKQTPEVIKFKFKGDCHLSMTSNHPVLIERNKEQIWEEAGKCKITDKVYILANVCKRCGVLIPYFRKYCSRTCLSKDITDKQWSNPEHRKNISEKNSRNMLVQYKTGVRDRNEITKAANIKTRQLVEKGDWILQKPEVNAKGRKYCNTPELRKKSSDRMKRNNPMNDKKIVQKIQKKLQELFEKHPEKRLNARLAKYRKSGNYTYIEKKVKEVLDKLKVNYIFQYPILRYNVDFAIPGLNIVIECDGEYWHQDKQKEVVRQNRIEKEGWNVFRFTGKQIVNHLPDVEKELIRIFANHTELYNIVPLEIEKIEKYTPKNKTRTYNFSVQEDESYMAKGIVIHNCRCMALPLEVGK